MPGRGSKPTFWGKLALSPHRENTPRTQCTPCAGGGEINGVRCSDCSGRGYFDAANTPGTDRRVIT